MYTAQMAKNLTNTVRAREDFAVMSWGAGMTRLGGDTATACPIPIQLRTETAGVHVV
jgi:hypothetical protein